MTLFLIAHKVRGAAAFDIALRCDSMGTPDDPGPWWVIPTSGHRAFPYWTRAIYMDDRELWINEDMVATVVFKLPDMPEDWPDHYSCNDRPTATAVSDILDILGLKPKVPMIRRRL